MYRFESKLFSNIVKIKVNDTNCRNLLSYKDIPGPKGLPIVKLNLKLVKIQLIFFYFFKKI